MNYFIFDYKTDTSLISSFIESASLAHGIPQKTTEWFLWKFRDNPFGEAILACARDNNKIVGCVAYGLHFFMIENKILKGGLSFETFVHPDYQRKGLFSKLIELAENEIKKSGIDFIMNFPNTNSLRGFQSKGWKKIDVSEYWMKPRSYFNMLLYSMDLRKGFNPNVSNIEQLKREFITKNVLDRTTNYISEIYSEYLNWRFFTYPNAEYIVVDDENCYSIARVGKRGNLKEIQVLFVTPKNLKSFSLKKLTNKYNKKSKYDLISFPISKSNNLRSSLKDNIFFKVPNSTNVCYRILDESLLIEMEKIELNAIDFHTY